VCVASNPISRLQARLEQKSATKSWTPGGGGGGGGGT